MDVSIRWRLMKYRDINCELLVNDDVMERDGMVGMEGWDGIWSAAKNRVKEA